MKIIIQIEDDNIRLKVPEFGFEQTDRNTVVVEPKQKRIMALGEDNNKMSEILKTNDKTSQFRVYRPFTQKDFNPDLALNVLRMLIRYVESKCLKGILIIPILLFHPVDVFFEFPDYDLVDGKLKELFERKLSRKLKVRLISINGNQIG